MDVAENNQPMESEAIMDENSDQMPTSGPLDRNDPGAENEESILRDLLNSIIPRETVEMGAVPTVAVQAAVNPEPEVQGQRAIELQNARDNGESRRQAENADNNGNQDNFSSNPVVRRAVRCFVDERSLIYDYIANKRDHRGELIAERCTVCQEDISTGETVRILICGHLFHDQCIVPWLVVQLHCPVCRQSLTEIEIETNFFTDSDQGFNGQVNDTPRNRAFTQLLRQVAPLVQAQLRTEARARAEAQAIAQAQIMARAQEVAETRAIVGVRPRTRARAIAECRPRTRAQAIAEGRPRTRARAIAEGRPRTRARAITGVPPRTRARAIAEGRARARGQAIAEGRARARAQRVAEGRARARARAIAETRAIDQARAGTEDEAQARTEAE